MADRRNPTFGSTVWAAGQFMRILEQEERRKAGRRGDVQTAQADTQDTFTPSIPPHKPTPPHVAPGIDVSAAVPSWRQDPRATRFIEEILSEEGLESHRDRTSDPGGHTMRGITAGTLRRWHQKHPGNLGVGPGKIPGKVSELTEDNALRILKEDVYDAYKLARIADDRLAHQLTDILTHVSPRGSDDAPGGAYQIVQRAINDVMKRNNLYNRHEQPFEYDHPADPLGRRTIGRLNWLVANGHGPELRNALVAHRFGYARTQPNLFDRNRGWNERIGRFTEWQHTPFGDVD